MGSFTSSAKTQHTANQTSPTFVQCATGNGTASKYNYIARGQIHLPDMQNISCKTL